MARSGQLTGTYEAWLDSAIMAAERERVVSAFRRSRACRPHGTECAAGHPRCGVVGHEFCVPRRKETGLSLHRVGGVGDDPPAIGVVAVSRRDMV